MHAAWHFWYTVSFGGEEVCGKLVCAAFTP
ncbi:DUF3265 domain-containing protein [Vibrio vulnificus]|nr:DUF3265 domain-containing protein [Vibrio vulnificus]MDK2683941.1 DUF3265 domain-containing protein [Vibrio vulnificus]